MTPNELTTILAEPLGRQFDIPFRLMLFEQAMTSSAQYIRQTLERDPRRRQELLSHVVLKTNREGSSLQTIESIPQAIYANGRVFDYVGSSDGLHPYTYVSSFSKVQYLNQGKFVRPGVKYYTFNNSKIEVFPPVGNPNIRVDTVFTDHQSVVNLNAKSQNADYWNTELTVPMDVLNIVIKDLKQQLQIEPRENEPETTSKDS